MRIIMLAVISIGLLQAAEKDSNLILLNNIVKQLNKLEEQKMQKRNKKNEVKKDVALYNNLKKEVSLSDKYFEAYKRQPVPIGYKNVAGDVTATIYYRGKILAIKEGKAIAGFVVKKITKNYVKFLNPLEKTIIAHYTVAKVRKK